MGKNQLKVPYEISETLQLLDAYVSVCYYELIGGTLLSSMAQRKQRAVVANNWEKFNSIGLATELYKQTKLMNTKGAY